jgi:hypothetical protein
MLKRTLAAPIMLKRTLAAPIRRPFEHDRRAFPLLTSHLA